MGLRRTAGSGTPSESRPTTQVRGHCQVRRTNPGVLWYHSPATLGSRLRFRETVLYSNPPVIPASHTIPPPQSGPDSNRHRERQLERMGISARYATGPRVRQATNLGSDQV